MQLDLLELPESLEFQAQWAQKERLGLKDRMAHLETMETLVQKAKTECPESLEFRALMVVMAKLEEMV